MDKIYTKMPVGFNETGDIVYFDDIEPGMDVSIHVFDISPEKRKELVIARIHSTIKEPYIILKGRPLSSVEAALMVNKGDVMGDLIADIEMHDIEELLINKVYML